MGHSLKKVLKTKPLRKIPQTDAIFENIAAKHAQAKTNARILRISIDVKAKVNPDSYREVICQEEVTVECCKLHKQMTMTNIGTQC